MKIKLKTRILSKIIKTHVFFNKYYKNNAACDAGSNRPRSGSEARVGQYSGLMQLWTQRGVLQVYCGLWTRKPHNSATNCIDSLYTHGRSCSGASDGWSLKSEIAWAREYSNSQSCEVLEKSRGVVGRIHFWLQPLGCDSTTTRIWILSRVNIFRGKVSQNLGLK